jgi:hypothetical protein
LSTRAVRPGRVLSLANAAHETSIVASSLGTDLARDGEEDAGTATMAAAWLDGSLNYMNELVKIIRGKVITLSTMNRTANANLNET